MLKFVLQTFGPIVDALYQRAFVSWKTSAGGVGIGTAFYTILLYIETQAGCDLSAIKPFALLSVVQGAFSTDANKTVETPEHIDRT